MARTVAMKRLKNEQTETLISQASLKLLSRYTLYTAVFSGVALMFPVVMQKGDIHSIDEGGFIETCQLLLLGLTALTFVIGFWLMQQARGAFAVLITFISTAIIRENDEAFSTIPVFGWHGPMAIVIILGAFLIYRYRNLLREGIDWVMSGYAFPLLWCGFIAAVPFAQLMGRFLTVLLGDDYTYTYKQFIQEFSELLGYVLILIGAIELVWTGNRKETTE